MLGKSKCEACASIAGTAMLKSKCAVGIFWVEAVTCSHQRPFSGWRGRFSDVEGRPTLRGRLRGCGRSAKAKVLDPRRSRLLAFGKPFERQQSQEMMGTCISGLSRAHDTRTAPSRLSGDPHRPRIQGPGMFLTAAWIGISRRPSSAVSTSFVMGIS